MSKRGRSLFPPNEHSMNRCVFFLAQLPQPSAGELFVFVTCVFAILGGWLVILKIQVARKQLAAPAGSTHRDLVQPLVVKEAEVYVKVPEFQKQISDLRDEMDHRFEAHEEIFRSRFHKLDNDLNSIKLEVKTGSEDADEQFRSIAGKLGELKGTSEQTNALAIRTDQAMRNLPNNLADQIAKAVGGKRA